MKLISTYFLILFTCTVSHIFAQEPANRATVILDSTKLPIVFINTNWQFIANDPKITIDFKIMDKGYNIMNRVGDVYNNYNGKAGIEKRGSITQLNPQNSYTLETRDAAGLELNVPLLGMPSEHDWVLYAPYDDHTFMRNALSYQLAREMGHWSSHTQFCEMLKQEFAASPTYNGIYLLTEKIKRDKNRVNIAKLNVNDTIGDALTGGYIIAIDQNIWEKDSGFTTKKTPNLFIKYVYPKADTIAEAQIKYIQNYVDSLETRLLASNFTDPVNGYRKYMDVSSFIDYFIVIEMSKSIDAYKRSAYMYKDKDSKGGKLTAGPYWDFNSAWWNAHACGFDTPTGWAYQMTCWVNSSFPVPFWWARMMQDNTFKNELNCRWNTLRQTTLSTAHIFQVIDSMATYIKGSGADKRQFTRWDITETFQGQVDTLKWYISNRVAWMDANMPGTCTSIGITDNNSFENLLSIFPNPAKDNINIAMTFNKAENLKINLVDVLGKTIHSYPEQHFDIGYNRITIPISDQALGIYYLQFVSNNIHVTKKVVISQN